MQIYNNEILKVLAEAGNDGLSVKKIARHVHNAHNTLFSNVSFDEVYAYVGQYLKRNSKCADSIIEPICAACIVLICAMNILNN